MTSEARDLEIATSINGFACEWPREIWQLYYTHVDRGDAKLYDRVGVVTDANYWTPRPYENEYNRGDVREGFTYTIAGRHVHQVTIAAHVVGSGAWDRLMSFRTRYKALEAQKGKG